MILEKFLTYFALTTAYIAIKIYTIKAEIARFLFLIKLTIKRDVSAHTSNTSKKIFYGVL